MARPTKKPRRRGSTGPSTKHSTARASLTSLPIEILAEVLLYTCSPPTVLAVSRTCSFLYHTLAQNPAASFIWRTVRNTCKPHPLPDLGAHWNKSEADYAALMFSGGVCEVCRRHTRAMYVSFAVRIRLCSSWHCRRKFLNESLIDISTTSVGGDPRALWVPCVESSKCFRNSTFFAKTWPHLDNILLRKTDWEKFQLNLAAYEAAEQAQSKRKDAVASHSYSAEDDGNKRIIERCNAAMQKIPAIMELSVQLNLWKVLYDQEYEHIKGHNRTWTKAFAASEGWVLEDLLVSQEYGSLQSRKNFLLEPMEARDVVPIRHTIESELLAIQARRKRQKSEAAYKKKSAEVKKIYERMRCGTLEMTQTGTLSTSEPLILPPLSIFCSLPSVRVLKGSPDPSAVPPHDVSTSKDIKSSSLATSLIVADIHNWLVPVQRHLMGLLGYPNGWQSASVSSLSPLKRVTARFFCRRCGEGKVGRAYQRELCLDLKGVCSHVCAATQRKGIEGPQQEAREDENEAADSGDGNGQEKEESRGKKKNGVKTPDWVVDVFEKDDKAIRFIKSILEIANLAEDSSLAAYHLKMFGSIIRCMTCEGWIMMDFETAIGHARRHETMKVSIIAPDHPVFKQWGARDDRAIPSSRHRFERGTCELLLGPSYRARSLCKKVNYGCKHCLPLDGTSAEVKAMTFHGLRSHVKEKHNIEDIRDEDFFCYSSIQKDERIDYNFVHASPLI